MPSPLCMSALSSSVLLGLLVSGAPGAVHRGRSAPFLLGMNSDQTRHDTTTALFLETCDAPPRLPMLPTPRHYSPSVDGAMVTGTPTARPGPLSPSRVLPMLTPLALLVAGQAGDRTPVWSLAAFPCMHAIAACPHHQLGCAQPRLHSSPEPGDRTTTPVDCPPRATSHHRRVPRSSANIANVSSICRLRPLTASGSRDHRRLTSPTNRTRTAQRRLPAAIEPQSSSTGYKSLLQPRPLGFRYTADRRHGAQ